MFKSGFSGLTKKLVIALGLPVLAGAQTFKYWNVLDTGAVPKLLSQTGMYTDIISAKKKVLTNVYHFEVNSALWSDGAHKMRWVMNKPGTSIKYEEKNDYWGFPDSSIFIKQFAIDTIPGDTNSRMLWETRFLVNRKEIVDSVTGKKMDRWYGYTYKWNKDQKDAKLVPEFGFDDSIKIYPPGKPTVMKKWRFPGRRQCETCHRVDYADTLHGRSVLGFFTAQLNRPHPDVANINQLEYFFQQNVLSGTKSNWTASTTPRWYGIDDSLVNGQKIGLDVRARSYIAANCSGCHGKRGMETGATFGVDLNYDFYTMESKMEFRHKSTSWSFGLDDSSITPKFYPKTDKGNNPNGYDSLEIIPALVVPGYPQKSVILFRQRARSTAPGDYDPNRNQMPPLATFEVNVPATNLIERWIKEWTPIPAPYSSGIHAYSVRTRLKTPMVQGRQVILPMEMAGPGMVKVTLTGISGRSQDLTQISRTNYALPSSLTPGVYVIRVGRQSFTRYLF
ncbi:MAG: hypothetical protein JWP91_661 [Fibrobacteres bacterium]|nr:hypothetical protein [Fibrobacterota bacterium]